MHLFRSTISSITLRQETQRRKERKLWTSGYLSTRTIYFCKILFYHMTQKVWTDLVRVIYSLKFEVVVVPIVRGLADIFTLCVILFCNKTLKTVKLPKEFKIK